MTFWQAFDFLDTCERYELRDYAFGDMEVSWKDSQGKWVAEGYSGREMVQVSVNGEVFSGSEARQLLRTGTLARISRNDSQG